MVIDILHRLNKLAYGDNLKSELAEAACLETVVWVMLCYRFEGVLQIQACAAVSNLSGRRENAELLGMLDACKQVVAAMKKHKSNGIVQLWGCRAMASMAQAPGNRLRLASEGAVAAAENALELYSGMMELTEPAVRVIEVCGASQANLGF